MVGGSPKHRLLTLKQKSMEHNQQPYWQVARHSPRNCPVSANAIAAQLVRNDKYEGVDRESSRLIFQEVSDRWRALIPSPVNLSGDFSSREFAAALQHVKPGKAPGPDSTVFVRSL